MIPGRGVWIEFETDNNGLIHARVDRTRKFPASLLLKAMGLSTNADIQDFFKYHKTTSVCSFVLTKTIIDLYLGF